MQTYHMKWIIVVLVFTILSGSFGEDLSDSDKVKAYVDRIRKKNDPVWELDPNESGFPNCRACTREYKQLSPPEQKFWKEVGTLNLGPEERTKLERKLHKILMLKKFAIGSKDLESHPMYDGSGEGRQHQKQHTKQLIDEADKLLNEIPTSARELLEFYINDMKLNKEEVEEKIVSIFSKLYFVGGWQAYEAHLTKETFEKTQIRTSKSFKVNNPNLTKSQAKDEL